MALTEGREDNSPQGCIDGHSDVTREELPHIPVRSVGRRWLSAARCGQPKHRQKLEGVPAFLQGEREDKPIAEIYIGLFGFGWLN